MSEWISVKESLPPEEVPVIGIHGGGIAGYPTLITVEWSRVRGWTCDIPSVRDLFITYWQSYPLDLPIKWYE